MFSTFSKQKNNFLKNVFPIVLKFRIGVFLRFVLPCAWVPCAYVFRKNEASKKRELTIPKAIRLFRKNEASKKRELTIPKAIHLIRKNEASKKRELTIPKAIRLIFRKNEASKKRELTIPKAIHLFFRKNEASKKRELTIPKAIHLFFLTKRVRHTLCHTLWLLRGCAYHRSCCRLLRGAFERLPGA